MKKLKLIICSLMVMMGSTQVSFAQPVQEGYFLIEATYGFPNLYAAVLKSAYVNSQSTEDVSFGQLGPMSIRGEYFITDGVSVGVEFVYTSNSMSYEENTVDMNGQPVTYSNDLQVNKYRVMPKFSFHYGRSDVVDFYTSIGAGYKRVNYTITTEDPNFDDSEFRNLIPIAFRVATGARFFFTENIGATLELGLGGGGLVSGGIVMLL